MRHSRWILGQDECDSSPGSSEIISDECCALEARACLDALGSFTCLVAWLFCAEERVQMMDEVAVVVNDAFLAKLERCLEDMLEMIDRKRQSLSRD